MAENFKSNQSEDQSGESEILVNDYGATRDSTVVVEEETRTVLLTDNETIIIEKEPKIDIVPKNRPRKIYAGMWGRAEVATVGLGMLAVLSVVILFVLVVLPARKELERNRVERARLDAELLSARNKYGDITSTEERVARLITSVDDFENRFLLSSTNGRTALYQRLNGLISGYGLVNSSGPDYAPMEISADRRASDSEAERGREKFQSLFPGVYITTTVEGSYQNLRRFIRDIETGGQFVVISAIELAPAENEDTKDAARASINNVTIAPQAPYPQNYGSPNAAFPQVNQIPNQTGFPPPATQTTAGRAAAPRGKTRGETVSLRLEMAAYFRRPNALPIPVVAQ
ncbi:MAG TPA: hypothetical protein VNI84_13495 [Pyrinomonadaceae bacterium]|nr:hypothetical protein [Pyrinomonadaceae bacterium]